MNSTFKFDTTDTCIPFFQKIKASKKNLFYIDRSRSQLILADYGLKYSYGEFICGNCSRHCKDVQNSRKVKKFRAVFAETRRACAHLVDYQEEYDGSSDEKSDDNDKDFVPDEEITPDQLLQELLVRCGSRTNVHTTCSYNKKEGQVRWNFLSIVRSVVNIIAPNDTDAVLQDLFHTTADNAVCRLDQKFISVVEGSLRLMGMLTTGLRVAKFFLSWLRTSVINYFNHSSSVLLNIDLQLLESTLPNSVAALQSNSRLSLLLVSKNTKWNALLTF